MRKAAEPGMVERIASFLGDNALTRSWAETVDRHVITPVELQFVKEMPDRDRFRAMASRLMADGGRLNEQGLEFVDAVRHGHGDTPETRQAMLGLFKQDVDQPHSEDVSLRLLGDLALKAEGEGLRKGLDVLAPRDGRNGYTEVGRQMRQWGLGSPVAAYSAVTAGGAMGTAAAIEAYDWWMAQQQQEQKDAQLPLQGGVGV
ncbi:MAG: hypothetical protein LW834_22240 [Cyanobium sp. 49614_E6]|jgi:hypothetical protein|nr:hypothetical protein [Cyanobium sp. 49614_E6]